MTAAGLRRATKNIGDWLTIIWWAALAAGTVAAVIIMMLFIACGPNSRDPSCDNPETTLVVQNGRFAIFCLLVWIVGSAMLVFVNRYVTNYSNIYYVTTLVWFPGLPFFIVFFLVSFVVGWIIFLVSAFTRIIDYSIESGTTRKIAEDEYGELYERIEVGGRMRFVVVRDKTGKHRLNVPPDTQTPLEGVAWTYNMKPDEYNPAIRT